MKLLITAFTFAPQRNGVAEVVGTHARGLAQRGHEVTVATAVDKGRSSTSQEGIRLVEFDLPHPASGNAFAETERYRSFISTFRCDAILCHCWRAWPTDLAIPSLKQNAARKILVSHGYTAHRWHWYHKFPWGLGGWVRGLPYLARTVRALRCFDHVVFLSPRADWGRFFDQKLVQWLGYPPSSSIPNGADRQFFENPKLDFRALHGLGDEFLILCVSAYAETKNQELALSALFGAGLARATIVFIGNAFNEYTDCLRRLNERSNPRAAQLRVLFLEKQSREMIHAAYAAADLFLLSSVGETQPLVVLDAMASGTAFISTDVGCVSDMAGGIVARTKSEMSREIARLHDNPDLRKKLAEEGRNACRTTYNWDTIIDSYERTLTKLTPEQP